MSPRLSIADGAADTALVADYERTRRHLIGRGLGPGTVVLAAGAVPMLVAVRDAFALELEAMAVAAYHDAHRRLRDVALLKTAASVMATEGQHLVVVRRALGRAPVPRAFETERA